MQLFIGLVLCIIGIFSLIKLHTFVGIIFLFLGAGVLQGLRSGKSFDLSTRTAHKRDGASYGDSGFGGGDGGFGGGSGDGGGGSCGGGGD